MPPQSSAFDAFTASITPGIWRGQGPEDVEVWICRVPLDVTDPIYGGLPLRVSLDVNQVVTIVRGRVATYFDDISHGAYQPNFVAGGEVSITPDEGPTACVDRAIQKTATTTQAVLVVADAEHTNGQPGGFGEGGFAGGSARCDGLSICPVQRSRRFAYVGASDFYPDWAGDFPMDLVEHEIGHSIGLVHSAYEPGAAIEYASALDVMSDSAAPRDVDATRRDGPDTLALQHLIAGWLPLSAVSGPALDAGPLRLQSSTADAGTRLLVLPVDDTTFLTVELLDDAGYDDHLDHDGVAVHRVRFVDGQIT